MTASKRTRKAPKVKWDEIRKLYEMKAFSVDELCRRTGVSRSQLYHRMKTDAWGAGMSAVMVARRTRERLVQTGAFDDDIEANIEIAAATNAQIIREHQTVASRGRTLALKMLNELEEMTEKIVPLSEIATAASEGAHSSVISKMNSRLSIHQRASTLKDLAASTATWMELERKAFNIDATDRPEDLSEEQIETRLKRLLRRHDLITMAPRGEYVDDVEDVEPVNDGE